MSFAGKECQIAKESRVLLKEKLCNNVYVVENERVEAKVVSNSCEHDSCVHLLHRRLRHASFQVINKTLSLLRKEKVKKCNKFLDCKVCKSVKSKVFSLAKQSTRRSEKALQLVHADVISPFRESFKGSKFALILTDNYSKFS